MTEKQVEMGELKGIIRNLKIDVQNNQTEYCNGSISDKKLIKRNLKYEREAIKQIRKKARECVHYKVMDIGKFDEGGNLIEKYHKPREVIITDSEIIKEILENIDLKFK